MLFRSLQPAASVDDMLALRAGVKEIYVHDAIKRYAIDIVRATRDAAETRLGAGPRASIAFLRVAQALALFEGLAYVTPDHLHACAAQVIAHRIVVDEQSKFAGVTGESIVARILASLPVPEV